MNMNYPVGTKTKKPPGRLRGNTITFGWPNPLPGGIPGPAFHLRDWSLITGRGGPTKWENRGSETFSPPPPQDRVRLFAPPLLQSGIFSCPPTILLKLQATHKNYPKTFCAPPPPPSAWLKKLPPTLFVGVKLHVPPPLPFCSPPPPPSRFVALPPPLPVISDQSLTFQSGTGR